MTIEEFLLHHNERISMWSDDPRYMFWKRNTKQDTGSLRDIVSDFFVKIFPDFTYVLETGASHEVITTMVKRGVISSYDRLDNFTKIIAGPNGTNIWYVKTSNRHKNKDTTYYVVNNHCFVSEHVLQKKIDFPIVVQQPFRTVKHLRFRILGIGFLIFMGVNFIASIGEYEVGSYIRFRLSSWGIDPLYFLLGVGILVMYLLYERQSRDLKKKEVLLDDPIFEGLFDTICDDQIFPRTILDADTMLNIVQGIGEEKKAYSFHFREKTMWMKYTIGGKREKHLFLPKTSPTDVSSVSFHQATRYMTMVKNIVKYCNL